MSAFRPVPLGEVLPSFPHGTVVSLPTMADVIAYERHDPTLLAQIRAGYPRFVLNAVVASARDRAAVRAGLDPTRSFALASSAAAARVIDLVRPASPRIADAGGWSLLEVATDSTERVAAMVRHAGLRLTSRAAETWLASGTLTRPSAEVGPDLASQLLPWITPCGAEDVRVTHSGMNAMAAAIDAVRAIQRPQGRVVWLQLGWLYVDTAEYLRKTLGPGETLEVLTDVADFAGIERFLARYRGRVAGIVTEIPTNPRLASADVVALAAAARREGALTLLDPSSSGLVNVDLVPWADLLVASLTKYSGHRGDLMAGLLAIPPSGPRASELRAAAFPLVEPLGVGDRQALAEQLPSMPAVADIQNRNARRLADFLERHPAVARVLTADRGTTAAAYARVARGPGRPGALITFELKGDLARFYDRVSLPKGPSFGLDFTVLAPFLWLSHFEMVTTEQGRAELRAADLNPDLVRVSVGTEDIAALEAAFSAALAD